MSQQKLAINVRRRAVFSDGTRVTKANGNDWYLYATRITGVTLDGEPVDHITFCHSEKGVEKTKVAAIKRLKILPSSVRQETVGTTDNVWEPVGDGNDRFLYLHRAPTATMDPAWEKEFSQKRKYLIAEQTKYLYYIYILGKEYAIDKATYEIVPYQGHGGPVFIGKPAK